MMAEARDLMASDPAVVTPDDAITDAALMRERDIGALPVVRDRVSMKLIGIITDRDIAIRCIGAHHGAPGQVRTHMTWGPLVTASLDTAADEIARRMQRGRIRRLPVVGRGDRLIGVVAIADLARLWARDHPREMIELLNGVAASSPVTVNA